MYIFPLTAENMYIYLLAQNVVTYVKEFDATFNCSRAETKIDGTSKTQVTELRAWGSWPAWGKAGIYFLSGRTKGGKNVQRIWRIKQ